LLTLSTEFIDLLAHVIYHFVFVCQFQPVLFVIFLSRRFADTVAFLVELPCNLKFQRLFSSSSACRSCRIVNSTCWASCSFARASASAWSLACKSTLVRFVLLFNGRSTNPLPLMVEPTSKLKLECLLLQLKRLPLFSHGEFRLLRQ
jgi:hypothetical protein